MPSPFPGMDPYLESRDIWPSFHHRLAVEIADQLGQQLDPRYYADVDAQTISQEIDISATHRMRPDAAVFESLDHAPQHSEALSATVAIAPAPVRRLIPSAEVRLHAVRIYVSDTGELVTAIEILSPYNKRASEGLDEYRRKRRRLLASSAHFIELDLLRGGQRPGIEVSEPPLDTDYVLLVNRADEQRISDIWPVALNAPLPIVPVPLLAPDPDMPLNVRAAIDVVYERARYARRINYRRPPPPPDLRPLMAEWFEQQRTSFR